MRPKLWSVTDIVAGGRARNEQRRYLDHQQCTIFGRRCLQFQFCSASRSQRMVQRRAHQYGSCCWNTHANPHVASAILVLSACAGAKIRTAYCLRGASPTSKTGRLGVRLLRQVSLESSEDRFRCKDNIWIRSAEKETYSVYEGEA